ncbi:MAG TPA: hypothetical protein VNF26_06910 [Candidatus Baltobacterales bacterium]|nr:hypothetical protein [Candidatus Baltobacterales bacterium]
MGVEVPMLLQFSIALFTGMVASTFVPAVRRVIPRAVEVGLWAAFATACVLGVINVTDPNARELTTSAFWGIDQLINNVAAGLVGGILGAISANRFAIAVCIVLLATVDVLALVLLQSYRRSRAWQPRVRLIEWMELPMLTPAPAPVPAISYGIDRWKRRAPAAMAVTGTTVLAKLARASVWTRNVLLPKEAARFARAAQNGRVESRTRLESLRDTTDQLQFAARAWYTAAGAPAVSGLAQKAAATVRNAQAARRLHEVAESTAKVVHIKALLGAQSIGWYGPLTPMQSDLAKVEEEEDGVAQRPDSLAS